MQVEVTATYKLPADLNVLKHTQTTRKISDISSSSRMEKIKVQSRVTLLRAQYKLGKKI